MTGGGTGLGRAIALDLARSGADVVLAGPPSRTAGKNRRRDRGHRLPQRSLLPADIREDDQVASLVDQRLSISAAIDILVNNAGGQFFAPAEDITRKGWRAVHRLAVDATWASPARSRSGP